MPLSENPYAFPSGAKAKVPANINPVPAPVQALIDALPEQYKFLFGDANYVINKLNELRVALLDIPDPVTPEAPEPYFFFGPGNPADGLDVYLPEGASQELGDFYISVITAPAEGEEGTTETSYNAATYDNFKY